VADVTERKRIQDKLHESEERLRGIIESAMDAIIAVDEQQRIVLFNIAAEKMLGCAANDVIGTDVDRFIPERFRDQHRANFRRFGDTSVTSRAMGMPGILWAVRANGEEFPVYFSSGDRRKEAVHCDHP
jgi:PAS domain S-box-containing protein